MITVQEDRCREAIIDSCQVRAAQLDKYIQPHTSAVFVELGTLFQEQRYALRVNVPVKLWTVLDSALDLAKCHYRGTTNRSLARTHNKLRRLLREDPVTRLGRIGGAA